MKRCNFLKTRKIKFIPKNLFTISLGTAFLISQPVSKVSSNPVTVTVNSTSYNLTTQLLRSYALDLNLMQSQDWYGNTSLAESLAGQLSNQLSITDPNASWLGAFLVTSNFLYEDEFFGGSEQKFNYKAGSTSGVKTGSSTWSQAGYYNFVINSPVSDDGDATYTISGTTTAGQTLST